MPGSLSRCVVGSMYDVLELRGSQDDYLVTTQRKEEVPQRRCKATKADATKADATKANDTKATKATKKNATKAMKEKERK